MITCKCGYEAKLLEVKKAGPNQGKKFYACPQPKESQCDFFEWADKVQNPKAPASQQYPPKPYQPRPLPQDPERLSDKDRAFGQAKGAAFNKSVDVIIAAYNKGEVNFEQIPEYVEKLFQEFVKINAEN